MPRTHSLRWFTVLTVLLSGEIMGQETPVKPKFDLDGDEMPAGAIARCGTIRYRHGGPTTCVTFSPDGKSLASIGIDGVRLFNAANGKLVHFWPGRFGIHGHVEFAPDGRSLFASHWVQLRELDVYSGKETRRLIDGSGTVFSFAISPDGKTIAIAGLDDIVLMNLADARVVRTLKGHKNAVQCVAFSPDGLSIASGGDDNTLRLWDVQSGKQTLARDLGDQLLGLVYSPQGRQLAVARGNHGFAAGVTIVDSVSAVEIRRFSTSYVAKRIGLSFSPDGNLLAIGESANYLRLVDPRNGAIQNTLRIGAVSISFAPDSKTLATAGDESVLRLWRTTTGERMNSDRGHSESIDSLAITPDTKTIATTSQDRTIRFWDTARGATALYKVDARPSTSAYFADNTLLYLIDENISAFNLTKDKKTTRLLSQISPASFGHGRAAFSQNGKFAASAVGITNNCYVFEAASAKVLTHFDIEGDSLSETTALAISPDGKFLATGYLGSGALNAKSLVRIWDVKAGKIRFALPGHESGADALEFTPSGRQLISSGEDAHIRFCSPSTGQTVAEWTVPNNEPITALAISADERTIASGSNTGTIRTWERLTGGIRRTLPGHLGKVKQLRFSPDGRLLVSGSADSTALVWRMSADESDKPAALMDLDSLWNDLQSSDAAVAERAIWRLASAEAAVITTLGAKLPSIPMADTERIKALITELNSNKFAERQQAETYLSKLGPIAEPALAAALDGTLSSEQRDRVKKLLGRLVGIPTGETLGAMRAVEALEHNGSADARRVLNSLATGSADPRIAESANESLKRIRELNPAK